MKISDAIAALEAAKKEHGDIECFDTLIIEIGKYPRSVRHLRKLPEGVQSPRRFPWHEKDGEKNKGEKVCIL